MLSLSGRYCCSCIGSDGLMHEGKDDRFDEKK